MATHKPNLGEIRDAAIDRAMTTFLEEAVKWTPRAIGDQWTVCPNNSIRFPNESEARSFQRRKAIGAVFDMLGQPERTS